MRKPCPYSYSHSTCSLKLVTFQFGFFLFVCFILKWCIRVYWECWIRSRWYFQLNSPPFPVILRKQFQILGVPKRGPSRCSVRGHCLMCTTGRSQHHLKPNALPSVASVVMHLVLRDAGYRNSVASIFSFNSSFEFSQICKSYIVIFQACWTNGFSSGM